MLEGSQGGRNRPGQGLGTTWRVEDDLNEARREVRGENEDTSQGDVAGTNGRSCWGRQQAGQSQRASGRWARGGLEFRVENVGFILEAHRVTEEF